MQQQLFSNSISIGLSGKFWSNGFTYAMPLPIIVCLGVNDVLFGHSVNVKLLSFLEVFVCYF